MSELAGNWAIANCISAISFWIVIFAILCKCNCCGAKHGEWQTLDKERSDLVIKAREKHGYYSVDREGWLLGADGKRVGEPQPQMGV